MNKMVQDLKMEIEAIKKTQSEGILEMENLGMRRGNTGVRITNRIQEIVEKISNRKYIIKGIETSKKKMLYLKCF